MKKENIFMLIIILAMLSWGGSWASGKAFPNDTALELVIFWRFFFTFISFIPIIILSKQPLKLTKLGFLQVVIGSLILLIYNFFFLYGERYGLANEGGVMVTTLNPLFTFMFSIIIFKQTIKRKDMIGLGIGLIGGAILFEVWNVLKPNFMNGGDLLFLLAAVSWALLSIVTQKSKSNMHAFTFSFYTYGIAAFVDFFIAIPKDVFNFTQLNGTTWGNIFYLSLAATTFGTTAYFYAASQLGAQKASTFTFLVPASAVFFSWLFLHESVNIPTIIGGLLALIAVYIVNYKPRKKKRS